ncbi:MAG: CDP-diacylglycerol--glycerol-3-phosphate 3-phosphatidyltransferase [Actinobacteria bacterium]|nr:CDP-diacylglycerol--glycerol-3-phosphate 3-phosphatidyltransferase [Actinomycetota bacterium]MCB9428422.1 CDP-diacylglycerol--glycerol-3-phosphate 3-phosphatidyltransferase [Actinomycetota bacterium]MCO5299721.1 CDP-diacylglycerol--glycerol-3-phosphate 3-phosphatidyltransferase [Candidatus Nanopelagicales bacterium]HPJ19412.1 CDP-diacylglycerol--glycerol-3-phosphate 3-phosphatidyltransferase [Actinomycetota bacterium]HRV65022.1 CDP-diacylglycerol--glycerol-3-phosphate 3-phosphatidyltransfera
MEVQNTEVQSDRVLTLPNVLSALRLLGVPLFLWLILVPQADGWAVALLMVAGFTDWLDGYLARKWNQITRVGQLLDPVADRLYILATLIGLLLRGIVPAWLVVLLISRDLILAVVLAVLKRRGVTGLPVHFLGKAATFCLLYAFPLLLLGDGAGWLADTAKVFGWAFAVWGTALYWWAAVLYVGQARRIMAASS